MKPSVIHLQVYVGYVFQLIMISGSTSEIRRYGSRRGRSRAGPSNFSAPSCLRVRSISVHRGNPAPREDVRSRIKRGAKDRERTTAYLRQESFQSRMGQAKLAASPEWGLAWTLEASERPTSSSLMAHREVAEALALARGVKRVRRMRCVDRIL